MGMKKARVEIEVQGDRQASEAVRNLNRELQQTEQQARRTGEAAQRAQRGMVEGNLSRLRQRGWLSTQGVKVGPIAIDGGGFRVRRGFLMGGGGTVMGAAVLVGGRALGYGLNQVADWIDYIRRDDVNFGEAAEAVWKGGWQTAFSTAGTQGMLEGIYRLAGGNREVFQEAVARSFFFDVGGRRQAEFMSQLDHENKVRTERLHSVFAQQDRAEQARKMRIEAIEAREMQANESAEEEYRRRVRGLRMRQNPVRLPEALYQLQGRLLDALYQQQRDQRIGSNRTAAEEALPPLLEHDGA